MNFNCDLKNGIVYQENVAIDADKIKKYSKLRFDIASEMSKNLLSKKQIIDILQICPAGMICEGNCSYCYNNYFADIGKNYLTPEKLASNIDYILKSTQVPEVLEIQFTGGDFLLHNGVIDLIKIIESKYQNTNFVFGFMVSCFYDDNQINYLKQIVDYVSSILRTHRICLNITMDIDGSNYRASLIKRMSNSDAINIGFTILRLFEHNDKVMLNINTKITDNTNVKVYLDNIQKINDMQLPLSLIKLGILEAIYTPSIKTIDTVINALEKEYGLYYSYGMRSLYINVDSLLSKSMARKYSLILMEVDDGIYVMHPFESRCWSNSRTVNILSSKYTACQYAPYTTDSIHHVLEQKFRDLCGINNKTCCSCELQGFCNMCCYFDCNQFPARKHFSKYMIKYMLTNPKHWLITNSIFNGDVIND